MDKLNYDKLMSKNPTKYDEITNHLGQLIEFFEHPTKGDEYPVIAVYRAEKIAVCTDFFDTDDMQDVDSDYIPCYVDGEMLCKFELN
jgi:hypothetical protein